MLIEQRVGYVRIVNNNKTVVGRFNGKDYKFEQGKPIDVPEVVAAHVFGFGIEDKTQCLNRLGWARSSDEIEAGLEKLGNVIFEDPPELVEKPKKGKKSSDEAGDDDETGTAGPPVIAGGPKGGGFNPSPRGPVRVGDADRA